MANIKCEYNWRGTGKQVFFDGTTLETLSASYPVVFYDDFIGADVVIPAFGSAESGCKWAKTIVGAAPPTLAKTADGVNGLVAASLTSADQKQFACMSMNDELMFAINQGAIFEARVALTTLPTLAAIAVIGLWRHMGDGTSTYRVGFEIPAGGVVTCESDDNVTDIAAATSTTLVAGTYYIFRIDCTDLANIKFFINGDRVAAGTTFANTSGATYGAVQPVFGMYKASGAGVGVMSIDYVKIFQNRAA